MIKELELPINKVIISRTDSIGDVMLTLPICTWLKTHYPQIEIVFLGKGYTRSVVEAFDSVDTFLDWDSLTQLPKSERAQRFRSINADAIIHVFPDKEIAALAKKVRIKMRIGTSHRAYHLVTCTHRLNFTRKGSDLHEAQLNHELLKPFGLTSIPSLEEIQQTTSHFHAPEGLLPTELATLEGFTILHPKSQGSAREWPMQSYLELTQQLLEEEKTVVFTGTESEGTLFRDFLPKHPRLIDTTGTLSLPQLIELISRADNLVACSTGPLHIAGFLNVNTVGLFSPRRPIHPGRWKALGKRVHILTYDPDCPNCKRGKTCNCIEKIPVSRVYEVLT